MTRRIAAIATTFAITMIAAPAQSQVQVVGFGGAEWDHADMAVYVAGIGIHPDRLGWAPAGSVTGYHISAPRDNATDTMWGFNPAVGLRHQWAPGAVQFNVGYLWLDVQDDDPAPAGPTVVGTETGMTISGQADYWGQGVRQGHALLFHNLGAGYTYGRLKGTQALFAAGPGQISIGGELVGQGGADYDAWQAAPLLQYGTDTFNVAGGVGYKNDTHGDGLYGRVEFAIFP